MRIKERGTGSQNEFKDDEAQVPIQKGSAWIEWGHFMDMLGIKYNNIVW
jgi:hypothetical protein